jgi:hypothetical protein
MNQEQLQQFILRRLGAPQLKVELTQDDLDDAVEEARRWFTAKKGVKRLFNVFVASSITELTLPEDVDTVTDVVFSQTTDDFNTLIDPLGLLDHSVPYNLFPTPGTMGLISTYAQSIMYLEMAKRVTGAEMDWRQDGRTLYILPARKSSGTIIVAYKSITITIEQLDERDHDLVKRYALAQAKQKLGVVRSKYDSYATAQGQTSLDGARLIQEAEAQLQLLEDEIAQSGFPMGLLVG